MKTWSETFSRLWENFTGVRTEGKAQFWRVFFWLLLLAGSVYASVSFRNMLAFQNEKFFASGSERRSAVTNQRHLDTVLQEVQAISSRRSNGFAIVQAMRNTARYAFNNHPVVSTQKQANEADSVIATAKTTTESTGLSLSLENLPLELEQESIIELPQIITVKAIMTIENAERTRMAVIDIDGAEQGRIIQVGDKFQAQGRKGRIIRIDNDKIVVQWNGRNRNIPLDS